MAGANDSSAEDSGAGRMRSRTPLLRLASNDRYVLDYGAKFRDLMGDSDTTLEAKCQRVYA